MLFSVVYIADFAIDNVSIGTLNCAEARLSAGSECVVAVGNWHTVLQKQFYDLKNIKYTIAWRTKQ